MDEKKSVDEKVLAVRKLLSVCDESILTAFDLLIALRFGADLDQEELHQAASGLLTAFHSLGELSSTVYDLAYEKE